MKKLIDAMEHPEKEEYQNFTIRVSDTLLRIHFLTKNSSLTLSAVPAIRDCNKD